MAVVEAILGKVRSYLDYPRVDAPAVGQILHILHDMNQHYMNMLGLTQEGWYVKRIPFSVQADTVEYPIAAGDFDGAILIETDPESYPTTRKRREIQICRYEDLNLVEPRSQTTSIGTAEVDTVTAVAFQCVEGAWTAFVTPYGAAGEYTIWYEPGEIQPTDLESDPQMVKAFHSMLALATAHTAVNYAKWANDDLATGPESDMARREELRKAIAFDLARHEAAFERYRFVMNSEDASHRLPFGRYRRAVLRSRFPWLRSIDGF